MLALVFVTGCSDKKIIENLGLISVMTFDKVEGGKDKMYVTASMPPLSPDNANEEIIIDTIADSKKEAENQLTVKTEQDLVNGQIRSLVFGKKFASEGINRIIQSVERDQEIGSQVKIVVADGEASQILTQIPQGSTSNYVDKILKKEAEQHSIPYSDVHHFSRDYYDDGIDPITPLIGMDEEDVVIKGTALFHDDRHVGNLNVPQSKILLLLKDEIRNSELVVKKLEENEFRNIYYTYNHSNHKIKVKKSELGVEALEIHVTIKGSLLEDTGTTRDVSVPDNHKEAEKFIKSYISEEANKVIEILKEKGADSIGMKQYIRNSVSYEEWEEMKKEDLLTKIPIKPYFTVVIKDNGMLQ